MYVRTMRIILADPQKNFEGSYDWCETFNFERRARFPRCGFRERRTKKEIRVQLYLLKEITQIWRKIRLICGSWNGSIFRLRLNGSFWSETVRRSNRAGRIGWRFNPRPHSGLYENPHQGPGCISSSAPWFNTSAGQTFGWKASRFDVVIFEHIIYSDRTAARI